MNTNIYNKISYCLDSPPTERQIAQLGAFEALVVETGARMSLVSKNDIAHLDDHIADSLSVLGGVSGDIGGAWLDIGSGAGFPAIPCSILRSDIQFVLIERRSKRCGFLHRVVNELELDNVRLIEGEFPSTDLDRVSFLTARAVEKPLKLAPGLADLMDKGAIFLCQNGDLADLFAERFHVEQIVDKFSESGLRRGQLYRIYSATASDVPRGTSS